MMRLLLAACLLLFSLSLQARQVSVFVSVPPLQYLAEQVGGDSVVVESMVSPGHNPVNYDPQPQQLQRLADADVYIRTGIPFELAWMPRLEELNPGMLLVDVRSNLPVTADGGHQQGSGAHHMDPHVWTSPLNAIAISRRILNALAAVAPGQQEQFRSNQQLLEQQLMELHQSITEALKPHTGASFLVFHPAWGYFAKSYGLRQMAIEIEGKEPGPKQLAGVIEAARRQQVGFLLLQEQFGVAMAKIVSDELGIELIRTNPLAYDLVGSLQQMTTAIAGSRHE